MADYTDSSLTNTTTSGRTNPMMTTMYTDREGAERGYSALQQRGYTDKDINLLMSDETRQKHFAHDHDTDLGNKAMEKAGVGSAVGGTIGAVAAAIAAIGTNLIIPGLGLVVAGPLAAGLAGAGAGGLTGGLIGALVGSGIPDDRAREYEKGINQGGIVMGVHPRSEEDARHLEQHGFR